MWLGIWLFLNFDSIRYPVLVSGVATSPYITVQSDRTDTFLQSQTINHY